MICPDNDLDCDNVGCRRGGCQGRRPRPPLLRTLSVGAVKGLPLLESEIAGGATALQMADRAGQGTRRRQPVVA
jgi:hypothetical protein